MISTDVKDTDIFSEGYPIPCVHQINESSLMNEYNKFFSNYYNK